MPFVFRRSVIKDAIGKVRSYLSHLANWQQSGKKRGKPGLPGAVNHPTLYEGTCSLELDRLDLRKTFVRLKVYKGKYGSGPTIPSSTAGTLSSVASARMGAAQSQADPAPKISGIAHLANERNQGEEGHGEQA